MKRVVVFQRSVLGISLSNLDSILVLHQTKQHLLTFANIPACVLCAFISGINPTFFFLHDTVRPNNHQTDAFSSGMSLNSFLTDRAISLLFIYSFSPRRSRPFRNSAWFPSSAPRLCAHASAILHRRVASVCLEQPAVVQVVGLLFSACCGVLTFASAQCVGRGVVP